MRKPTPSLNAFLSAWLVTYSLASIFHSQFVLINLLQLGVAVPVNDWLAMTVSDWWGMLPKYGSAIAVLITIVLGIGHGICRLRFLHRLVSISVCFFVLGWIGMFVMLMAMNPVLDVTLIAGARTLVGQCFQATASGLGCALYVFFASRTGPLVHWPLHHHQSLNK